MEKSLIEFTAAGREEYLRTLNRQLSVLCNHLYSSKALSSQIIKYYETFTDLVGAMLYSNALKDADSFTASSTSGMPLYSKVLGIVHDQSKKDFSKIQCRDEKLIVDDIVDSIYLNNAEWQSIFRREFQKAYYYNKLLNMRTFDDFTSISKGSNNVGIERFRIEHASYALTDMSCISLTIDASCKFALFRKKSISEKGISGRAALPLESIYEWLFNNKIYAGCITKTIPYFYFRDKMAVKSDDAASEKIHNNAFSGFLGRKPKELNKLFEDYPKSYMLEFTLNVLENLDIMVAADSVELESARLDDFKISKNYVVVASHDIVDDVKKLYSGNICKVLSDDAIIK